MPHTHTWTTRRLALSPPLPNRRHNVMLIYHCLACGEAIIACAEIDTYGPLPTLDELRRVAGRQPLAAH